MNNKTNIIKKMNKQLFLNALDTYFNTIKKNHGITVPGGVYIIKINKTLYIYYKLLYKFFYNYIKSIKNKIDANNHMILSNIEYLKHDDMFVDLIYVLIYNRKEIFNTIVIIIKKISSNFTSKSIKYYYVFYLKSILSFMVEYVYKNDICYYITSKITLKHIRKFIRGILHTVKTISAIFVMLCFYYNVNIYK